MAKTPTWYLKETAMPKSNPENRKAAVFFSLMANQAPHMRNGMHVISTRFRTDRKGKIQSKARIHPAVTAVFRLA